MIAYAIEVAVLSDAARLSIRRCVPRLHKALDDFVGGDVFSVVLATPDNAMLLGAPRWPEPPAAGLLYSRNRVAEVLYELTQQRATCLREIILATLGIVLETAGLAQMRMDFAMLAATATGARPIVARSLRPIDWAGKPVAAAMPAAISESHEPRYRAWPHKA